MYKNLHLYSEGWVMGVGRKLLFFQKGCRERYTVVHVHCITGRYIIQKSQHEPSAYIGNIASIHNIYMYVYPEYSREVS